MNPSKNEGEDGEISSGRKERGARTRGLRLPLLWPLHPAAAASAATFTLDNCFSSAAGKKPHNRLSLVRTNAAKQLLLNGSCKSVLTREVGTFIEYVWWYGGYVRVQ